MVTGIVRDSNQVNRTIIKGTVEDGVVFVVSNAEFTIDSTDPNNVITGFDVIRQGVTLRNTTAALMVLQRQPRSWYCNKRRKVKWITCK